MEYVFYYLLGCFILGLGYMLGVKDERKNGPAACQKIMDEEIAAYYEETQTWNSVDHALLMLDFEPASKRIIHYGRR